MNRINACIPERYRAAYVLSWKLYQAVRELTLERDAPMSRELDGVRICDACGQYECACLECEYCGRLGPVYSWIRRPEQRNGMFLVAEADIVPSCEDCYNGAEVGDEK